MAKKGFNLDSLNIDFNIENSPNFEEDEINVEVDSNINLENLDNAVVDFKNNKYKIIEEKGKFKLVYINTNGNKALLKYDTAIEKAEARKTKKNKIQTGIYFRNKNNIFLKQYLKILNKKTIVDTKIKRVDLNNALLYYALKELNIVKIDLMADEDEVIKYCKKLIHNNINKPNQFSGKVMNLLDSTDYLVYKNDTFFFNSTVFKAQSNNQENVAIQGLYTDFNLYVYFISFYTFLVPDNLKSKITKSIFFNALIENVLIKSGTTYGRTALEDIETLEDIDYSESIKIAELLTSYSNSKAERISLF